MKKLLALLLAFAIVFSLTACFGGDDKDTGKFKDDEKTAKENKKEEEEPEETEEKPDPLSSLDSTARQMYDQIKHLENDVTDLKTTLADFSDDEKLSTEYGQTLFSLIDVLYVKIEVMAKLVAYLEEEEKASGAAEIISNDDLLALFDNMIVSESQCSGDSGMGTGSTGTTLIDAFRSQLQNDKDEILSLVTEAEDHINALETDLEKYESAYQSAKISEAALDAQIEALLIEREINRQEAHQQTSIGEFMWPLSTSVGYISCYFGGSDPNGAPHWAVDIAGVATSTPIYASNDGTVIMAKWHESFGYFVLIDHNNGYATLYAHCSSITAEVGQTVTKGETIAYCGSTGFSIGNHLHFEFRSNGQKVDPFDYMTVVI